MVKKKLYFYSGLLFLIISLVSFTFVYGPVGIPMAISFQIILGILLLLGFIPIVGAILYGWWGWFHAIPWLLAIFGGASWEWPVTLIFALNLIISVGCTVYTIIRIFTTWWRY